MKVAIIGSRTLANDPDMERYIQKILDKHREEITEMISGGCIGVDEEAERMASLMGIPTNIYFPENKRWSPNGYRKRNRAMAEDCDIIYALIDMQSSSFGAGWTVNYAKQIGKKVVIKKFSTIA